MFVFLWKENGKKEMIKEKLQLLEKALEKVKINFENRLVCFRYKRRSSGLTNVNSTMYLSQGNLGCITFILNHKPLASFNVQVKQIRSSHLNLKSFHYKSLRSKY